MHLTLFIAPHLKSARKKICELLSHRCWDAFFLDAPRDIQESIQAIWEGVDYKEILLDLEEAELIQRPVDAPKYKALEPVLEDLWRVRIENPELELYCYEKPTHSYSNLRLREITSEIFVETAKVAARAKVDVNRWRELLEEELSLNMEASEEEADFIASKAKEENACSSSVSYDIAPNLEKRGLKLRTLVLGSYLAPLAVLRNKLRDEMKGLGEVQEKEIEQLVLDHVRFVHMVEVEGFENAHDKWIKEMLSFHRRYLHKPQRSTSET